MNPHWDRPPASFGQKQPGECEVPEMVGSDLGLGNRRRCVPAEAPAIPALLISTSRVSTGRFSAALCTLEIREVDEQRLSVPRYLILRI